jgi:hypothetical protein
MKKRKFSIPEFKAEAGLELEVMGGIKTINEIGRKCSVHPVIIGHWMKESQERAGK